MYKGTPLHKAAYNGNYNSAKTLVEKVFNLNVQDIL
ncbi:hypothetical protein [Stygiolobus sp. CP859M]